MKHIRRHTRECRLQRLLRSAQCLTTQNRDKNLKKLLLMRQRHSGRRKK